MQYGNRQQKASNDVGNPSFALIEFTLSHPAPTNNVHKIRQTLARRLQGGHVLAFGHGRAALLCAVGVNGVLVAGGLGGGARTTATPAASTTATLTHTQPAPSQLPEPSRLATRAITPAPAGFTPTMRASANAHRPSTAAPPSGATVDKLPIPAPLGLIADARVAPTSANAAVVTSATTPTVSRVPSTAAAVPMAFRADSVSGISGVTNNDGAQPGANDSTSGAVLAGQLAAGCAVLTLVATLSVWLRRNRLGTAPLEALPPP